MKFCEALAQILQTESREPTGDAFYLYSRLSDLCTSFEDREKVSLFFRLDKRLHIVNAMQTEGQIAVPVLKAAYPAVREILSQESYKKLIDCVAAIFFPQPVKQIRNTPQKPIQKAVVQKAPEEKAVEPRTPLTSTYVPYTGVWKQIVIIGAIILAVIAGITCLIVFRKHISWMGWQYMIGLFGGLVLTAIVGAIAFFIAEGMVVEIYQTAPFLIFAVTVINFVLFCIFRADYKIIFIFLSAYSLIGAGIMILFAFDDLEEGWGIGQIAEAVVVAAGLALGLIFL